MRKQSMGRNIGAHGGIRVLLVDDSLLFLQAATFFLHQEPGVQVVGALCRGERLMSEALSLRPQIVVMDPGVAGLAGMQLISQLHSLMPEIRVIVLTLIDVDAFRYTALAAGAAAFVSKVSARTDLLSAIRTAAQIDPDEARDDPAPDPGHFNGSLSTLKGGPVYG